MASSHAARFADVVIIGGGIIGAACAEALSKEGLQVFLVERSGLASGTSSACQGGTTFDLFAGEYELQLSIEANKAYQELSETNRNIDYERTGSIFTVEPDQEYEVKLRIEHLKSKGLAIEWLERASLGEIEPAVSHHIIGAVLAEDTGVFTPMRAVAELVNLAIRRGTQVWTDAEVIGIEKTGGKVTAVNTGNGRIATDCIIIAAGPWSRQVSELIGLDIPVWPQKGHIIVTEAVPGLIHHFILGAGYHTSVDMPNHVKFGNEAPQNMAPQIAAALHPLQNGRILIGSSREFSGYSREVNRKRLAQIADQACQLIPDLRGVRVIRTYAGLRPWTPDGRPLIGFTRRIRGVLYATGHGGEGNRLALVTGRIVADLITGRPSFIPLTPLSPDRFILS